MIDEQLRNLYLDAIAHGRGEDAFGYDEESMAEDLKEALTAIYEIGLECIGADEITPATIYDKGHAEFKRIKGIPARNELRASQRKAWAKACGVAEK